jgi:hypothetical protein
MRRVLCLSTLIALAGPAASGSPQPTAPTQDATAVRAARVIDGKGGVLQDNTVIVTGSTIGAVSGARPNAVIDLGGLRAPQGASHTTRRRRQSHERRSRESSRHQPEFSF